MKLMSEVIQINPDQVNNKMFWDKLHNRVMRALFKDEREFIWEDAQKIKQVIKFQKEETQIKFNN